MPAYQLQVPAYHLFSPLAWIQALVKNARLSSKGEFRTLNITPLLTYLEENPLWLQTISKWIQNALARKSALKLYTDSGLLSDSVFYPELKRRFNHFILPEVIDKQELRANLNLIFSDRQDYEWLEKIPSRQYAQLLSLLGLVAIQDLQITHAKVQEIIESILIISQRLAAIGIDPELVLLSKEKKLSSSPFIRQNSIVKSLVSSAEASFPVSPQIELLSEFDTCLEECNTFVERIKILKTIRGTSFRSTLTLLRIQQHVNRLQILIALLLQRPALRFNYEVYLFTELVKAENQKNSFRQYIADTAKLMSQQIIRHISKAGEQLIANTGREFFIMLLSAIGGGLVITFFCIFKLLLSEHHFAPVLTAFVYGLNYAVAFIVVQILGFSIATKQPAMTATVLAQSMAAYQNEGSSIQHLVEMIVRITRSQFISFVGNLAVVLPLPFLLAWLYQYASGMPFVAPAQATKMLLAIHPLHSLSLWFAAIAGVCLFISGIINGYYDNINVYSQIHLRIARHRILKFFFTAKRRRKIGHYLSINLGKIAGNLSLGFLLGSMATIGFLLGLPLDIRHITFSAGNFSLALASLGISHVPLQFLLTCLLGVFLIGFINFLVSFGFTVLVVLRSGGIRFRSGFVLIKLLLLRFIKSPLDFFFPLRR